MGCTFANFQNSWDVNWHPWHPSNKASAISWVHTIIHIKKQKNVKNCTLNVGFNLLPTFAIGNYDVIVYLPIKCEFPLLRRLLDIMTTQISFKLFIMVHVDIMIRHLLGRWKDQKIFIMKRIRTHSKMHFFLTRINIFSGI